MIAPEPYPGDDAGHLQDDATPVDPAADDLATQVEPTSYAVKGES